MRRIGLVLVAVALPTVAALADDRPPMKPTRDATVTYKTVGADGGHTIKMSFSAQTGLIRSDMPNMQGYMIVDRDRQKSTMVMTEQRMFMEMDSRMNPQAQAMTAPSTTSPASPATSARVRARSRRYRC